MRFKKLLLSLFFSVLIYFAQGQDYYKIHQTKLTVRYYKTLDKLIEPLNDSMYLKIERVGSLFRLSILDASEVEVFNCFYKFKGTYDSVTRATRSTHDTGTKVTQKSTKIKVLMPIKDNCVARISK